MLDDIIGFFIEPLARPIMRGVLMASAVSELGKQAVKEEVRKAEKANHCDFCDHPRDTKLGSGLLCGHHYHKLFGSK